MKMTGGQMRGCSIRPSGLGAKSSHGVLRPTSSKVRQALFNIIGQQMDESVFCDLYAGTGIVGMEAMSRGASTVYFVEADRVRVKELEHTLDGCGCRSKANIINARAEEFIKRLSSEGRKLSVIFMDPPYKSDEISILLPLIGSSTVLDEGALVVVEHSSKMPLPAETGRLRLRKDYKYGDTKLSVYECTA